MPRALVKVDDDRYLLWSTVVDAPVSYLLTRADVVAAPHIGDDQLAAADTCGHGFAGRDPASFAELAAYNRAGPGETCLTPDAIVRRYESAAACQAFVLTDADIAPYLCDVGGQLMVVVGDREIPADGYDGPRPWER